MSGLDLECGVNEGTYLSDAVEPISNTKGDEITITFKDVNLTITTKVGEWPWQKKVTEKKVLHNISGSVEPGRMLAIMGPTGSGKTSLLNVLSGKIKLGVTGDISVNGQTSSKQLKRKTAFIMQKDIFFSDLTVRETLTMTALLRLPAHLSKEEKLDKVEKMMEKLGLMKAANTIIGGTFPLKRGISGGEQKRLNIGNELLTDPSLLMIDEPTAGLDSNTALVVLKLLKQLSLGGHTIVTTIHQPSSEMYTLFDDLMLLSDGHVVYYGAAKDATAYFSNITLPCPAFYNPADYLLKLLSETNEKGEPLKNDLIEHYNTTVYPTIEFPMIKPKEVNEEKDEPKWPTSFFHQFALLGWRSFRQKKGAILQRLYVGQILFAIFVISMLWFQLDDDKEDTRARFGLLFISTVYWILLPMLRVVSSFPAERGVLSRERSTGTYRLSAFYLSKQCAEIPLEFILPIIYCIIVYWATGLNRSIEKFIIFTVVILLDVAISYSIGLWISSAILSVPKAAVVVTSYFLLTMLLGGFYIEEDAMPIWLSWAQYLSPARYVFETLLINEFKDESFESDNGNDILDDANIDAYFFPYNFVLLVVALIISTIMGYLSLRFLNQPKH